MLSELKNSPKVVGVKQLRKALNRGELLRVFLASDTMRELGAACGIAVGASAAGLRRPEG